MVKTKTVTVSEGECLGPIDWDYDFRPHFNCYCETENNKDKRCERYKEMLKKLEQNPEKYQATTDGGYPRCGWSDVVKVGMYDGWPYWRPVPSVLMVDSVLGGAHWHSFNSISDIREKES